MIDGWLALSEARTGHSLLSILYDLRLLPHRNLEIVWVENDRPAPDLVFASVRVMANKCSRCVRTVLTRHRQASASEREVRRVLPQLYISHVGSAKPSWLWLTSECTRAAALKMEMITLIKSYSPPFNKLIPRCLMKLGNIDLWMLMIKAKLKALSGVTRILVS